MALKVAIVGLSPGTHDAAPWTDQSWQKWGMPWDWRWAELDRCFEVHQPEILFGEDYPPDYRDRLENCAGLVLQRDYPIDAVIKTIGRDYFQSSVAYMLALAIHEGATEIGLWGVEMGDDTPYAHQRANAEFLIGLAIGKGIKVSMADPLCSYRKETFEYDYPHRYGWET